MTAGTGGGGGGGGAGVGAGGEFTEHSIQKGAFASNT